MEVNQIKGELALRVGGQLDKDSEVINFIAQDRNKIPLVVAGDMDR